MTDLSTTIAPKSNQMNADDLIGGPRTITITKVGLSDTPEQPIAIYFEDDDGKPYLPCKSMRRVLVHVWGNDGAGYVGRALTLYRDPDVMFGGIKVGGIRISHMSHIDGAKTMALTATRASRKPFTVKPLATKAPPKQEVPREETPPADPPPFDGNGPLLALVDSKGKRHEIGAPKWERTLAGWFEKLPFDTAAQLYKDNYEHLEWARLNGFDDVEARVRGVWMKRQEEGAIDA